jgi:hypothetical protein
MCQCCGVIQTASNGASLMISAVRNLAGDGLEIHRHDIASDIRNQLAAGRAQGRNRRRMGAGAKLDQQIKMVRALILVETGKTKPRRKRVIFRAARAGDQRDQINLWQALQQHRQEHDVLCDAAGP